MIMIRKFNRRALLILICMMCLGIMSVGCASDQKKRPLDNATLALEKPPSPMDIFTF